MPSNRPFCIFPREGGVVKNNTNTHLGSHKRQIMQSRIWSFLLQRSFREAKAWLSRGMKSMTLRYCRPWVACLLAWKPRESNCSLPKEQMENPNYLSSHATCERLFVLPEVCWRKGLPRLGSSARTLTHIASSLTWFSSPSSHNFIRDFWPLINRSKLVKEFDSFKRPNNKTCFPWAPTTMVKQKIMTTQAG